MAKKPLPTPDELRQLLRYEPDTGKLFWLPRDARWFKNAGHRADHTCAKWNSRWANKEALYCVTSNGYKHGAFLGRRVSTHRVIWAIVHGEWPDQDVDHINGVRDDNRLANLRCVSRQMNLRNMRKSSRNTSGHTGVYWNIECQKWEAKIRHNDKQEHLGVFASIEEAIAVRSAAERRHGYSATHGKR